MFKKISYKIALQFTGFVFLLFLVNGTLFLVADFSRSRQMTQMRLERMESAISRSFQPGGLLPPPDLPQMARGRMRILDANGDVLYGSEFFEGIPFTGKLGLSQQMVQNEPFAVFTARIVRNGQTVGFAQVAEMDRQPRSDLLNRAFLYILLSASISVLTFIVGLFFARRSLRPAEETMLRLEQFTQDASHELRTPLAALSSSLDLALKTHKYKEGIASAKEDVKGVTALVERLLELARLDKFVIRHTSVDLSALTEDTVNKFQPLAAEKKVAFTSHVAPEVTVTGDALLIRQVLGNLLTNAIKFSKSKGGEIAVHLTKNALSVKDTGIGIAHKELAHIFDRFYQAETSRSNGGYGLGLALVKRIVDLHEWRISVHSKEGEGSTFTVHFS